MEGGLQILLFDLLRARCVLNTFVTFALGSLALVTFALRALGGNWHWRMTGQCLAELARVARLCKPVDTRVVVHFPQARTTRGLGWKTEHCARDLEAVVRVGDLHEAAIAMHCRVVVEAIVFDLWAAHHHLDIIVDLVEEDVLQSVLGGRKTLGVVIVFIVLIIVATITVVVVEVVAVVKVVVVVVATMLIVEVAVAIAIAIAMAIPTPKPIVVGVRILKHITTMLLLILLEW